MAPSSAVTSTLMAFAPSESAMAVLSEPLVTAERLVPLPTLMEAPVCALVGVSFTCVMLFATEAVYEVVVAEKVDGVSASAENVPVALVWFFAARALRFALVDWVAVARVTVTV